MFCDTILGVLIVSCLLTPVWGNVCNQPDNKVLKICRGGSLRSSERIYLEVDLTETDGATECTCTTTFRKTGNDANPRELTFFRQTAFANCNYRLEMQRPGVSGKFDCLQQTFAIPFTLNDNDQVNVRLIEDLSSNKVAQFCVHAQLKQGTVDAEFEITCQQVISGGGQQATTTQPTTTTRPTTTTTQTTTQPTTTTQTTTTSQTTTQATTTSQTTTQPTTTSAKTTQATTSTEMTQSTATSSSTTHAETTKKVTTKPTTMLQQMTTTQVIIPSNANTMPANTTQKTSDVPSDNNTVSSITSPSTRGHENTMPANTTEKTPDVPIGNNTVSPITSPTTGKPPTRQTTKFPVDVFKIKGEVIHKDQSHIIIPVAVGVGMGLIIVAIIAVLLYQKSRRENQSNNGDQEELAEPIDVPDGTLNKDYVTEDVQY